MKKYEYSIRVQDLIPPIANMYRHFAIVAYIYEIGAGADKKIDVSFGETHGKTEKEAEEKMREKVEEWIKNNQ
jgi:hypothetical protein